MTVVPDGVRGFAPLSVGTSVTAPNSRQRLLVTRLTVAAAVSAVLALGWVVLSPVGSQDHERTLQTGGILEDAAASLRRAGASAPSWDAGVLAATWPDTVPRDAWGRPLRVVITCDGNKRRFEIRSDGPSATSSDDLVVTGPDEATAPCP